VIRLCDQWKSGQNRKAVFLNVEGRSDELAFAEKLIDELAKAGLDPEILTRAIGVFNKIRGGLGLKQATPDSVSGLVFAVRGKRSVWLRAA
jgi:hypothetical protein